MDQKNMKIQKRRPPDSRPSDIDPRLWAAIEAIDDDAAQVREVFENYQAAFYCPDADFAGGDHVTSVDDVESATPSYAPAMPSRSFYSGNR